MKCDVNTLKDMRGAVQAASKEVDRSIELSGDGSSPEFQQLFMEDLAKQVRDPAGMMAALQERIDTQERPFHRILKREMGESVYVDNRKVFIKEAYIGRNEEAPGGVELVLKTVDKGMNETVYKFSMDSDQSREGVGAGQTRLPGVSDIFRKVLVEFGRERNNEKVTEVTLDPQGVAGLTETLNKMAEADEVLGSKQDRNAEDLMGYERITNYKHGDVASMKAILHRLHTLGGSKAGGELLSYYNELLDSMHPRFFNELQLFLKENGVTTQGFVDVEGKGIYIKSGLADVEGQTEAEVYMHELVHAMTYWALRQPDKNLTAVKTQLAQAQKTMQEKTTWEDMLRVPKKDATAYEIKRAQRMYDYLFVGKNSLDEFIAYTMTNPAFMELAKKVKVSDGKREPITVYDKVVNFFTKLIDVAFGKYRFKDADISVFTQVNSLAFALAEVNNDHQRKLSRMNPLGLIGESVNKLDRAYEGYLNDLVNKIAPANEKLKKPEPNASVMAKAKYIMATTVKSVTDPVYRNSFGLVLSAFRIKPESTVREVFRSFLPRDEVFRAVESLGLLKTQIDAHRNGQIDATTHELEKSFSRKLSKEEDTAITRVMLDTNLASLRYKNNARNKLSDKKLVEMLTSEASRKKEEIVLKNRIRDLLEGQPEERIRWTTTQAVTLGHFMATHKAHIAQLFNGDNIAEGLGRPMPYASVPGLAQAIEDLATVSALKYTKQEDKNLVVELLRTERKGMQKITDTYQNYVEYSKKVVFAGENKVHRMLGHSKELFDTSVDIAVAPVADRKEMEANGYTYRFTLEPKNGDTHSKPMAMYSTGTWGKAERQAGAVGLGDANSRGTTMSSMKNREDPIMAKELFGRDFARVQIESYKLHKAMEDGTVDLASLDYSMAPVLNHSGKVTDYRYMMGKEEKAKLLNQDTSAIQVLGRSKASAETTLQLMGHNARVLEVIKQDMKENWKEGEIGFSGEEYALIGPDSADPEMRALYDMLPSSFKQYIQSRDDQTMAVKRTLMHMYFGYKHMRFSDMPGIKHMPLLVKNMINIIEGMWMELVKVSKAAILMKMPLILVVNLLTSIRYMINTGSYNILELTNDYKDSFREVGEYIRNDRELQRLRVEVEADEQALLRVRDKAALTAKIRHKKTRLQLLKDTLDRNPAADLFAAGMYQSYIQDVETSKLAETNKIAKVVNDKLDKAPAAVRTAAQIAYVTQQTTWYKVSQEIMQRTDMVSRLAEKKRSLRQEALMADGEMALPMWWVKERQKATDVVSGGKKYKDKQRLVGAERAEFFRRSKEVRMASLLDNYINYTMPNGRGEEYLNRLGILMFTKYVKRIQKIVINTAVSHPVKSGISMLTTGMITGNEAFLDQSFLHRAIGRDGSFDLFNIIPTYGLGYHIENVFTPALLKDSFYMNML